MKATRKQIALRHQRIQAILQIRLDGAERWDCVSYVAEKEAAKEEPWTVADGAEPLTAAQIGTLGKAADALITAAYPDDAPEVGKHKAKLRNCYARAIQSGDVRTAQSILSD